MKTSLLLSAIFVVFLGTFGSAWACPNGDPNDNGVCDTLYVICNDTIKVGPPPWEVHFSFLVAHDIVYPYDSIAGFAFPMKVSHTNSSSYCSLLYQNNSVYFTDTANSIFRHFDGMQNRMMDMYEEGNGAEWDTRILNIYDHQASPDYFYLALVPGGPPDQPWSEGSEILLATFTLLVGDTMTVCVDSSFDLQPTGSRLVFSRMDAVTYIPRHNMPACIKIRSVQRGDANTDGKTDLGDVVYLITYLYKNGSAPNPLEAGDANCDGVVELGDAVYLINYLYKNGPVPQCP